MMQVIYEIMVPFTLPLKKGGFIKVFALVSTHEKTRLVHPGKKKKPVDRSRISPLALEYLEHMIKEKVGAVHSHLNRPEPVVSTTNSVSWNPETQWNYTRTSMPDDGLGNVPEVEHLQRGK